MSEESESKATFVVKDKRRFDMEGNEKSSENEDNSTKASNIIPPSSPQVRSDSSGVTSRQTNSAPSAERATASGSLKGSVTMKTSDERPSGDEPSEIDFNSFIISLATQALMQLGEMQPPPGVSVPTDKDAAKQTIDILSMLEQKTRGNLERDEEKLLQEILHNVRLSFVRSIR